MGYFDKLARHAMNQDREDEARYYADGGAVTGTPQGTVQSSDPNQQAAPVGNQGQGGSGLFGSLSNVDAGWALPQSGFQANAATQGSGTTQLNDTGAYGTGVNTGYGQEAQAFGGENNLASTLTSEANGGGPNLGATQLAAGTAQNVNQVAGQLASQRGINPALAQSLASTNQAQANQAGAGQAAAERQQQQLAAQSQLAGVLGTQQSGGNQLLSTSAQANQSQNATNLQNLTSQEQLNQLTASQNAQQLANAQALNAGQQRQGTADVAGVVGGVVNSVGGLFGTGAQNALSGLLGGTPSSAASPAGAVTQSAGSTAWSGGVVPHYDAGGSVEPETGEQEIGQGIGSTIGNIIKAIATASRGGVVPGHAKVPGDSPKNDTIPARVSPGEIIIPREAAKTANGAKAFIDSVLKDKGDASIDNHPMAELLAIKAKLADLERRYGKRV